MGTFHPTNGVNGMKLKTLTSTTENNSMDLFIPDLLLGFRTLNKWRINGQWVTLSFAKTKVQNQIYRLNQSLRPNFGLKPNLI